MAYIVNGQLERSKTEENPTQVKETKTEMIYS
jgi:hypothetical protein